MKEDMVRRVSKRSRDGRSIQTSRDGWVERNFKKMECAACVPTTKTIAQCGQTKNTRAAIEELDEDSTLVQTTISSPTDAFGTIHFSGDSHPTKAKYIRLAVDTTPELIFQLLTREWGLGQPKFVISVQHGDRSNSSVPLFSQLQRVFTQGLVGVANTTETGFWIITEGTNICHHEDSLQSLRALGKNDQVLVRIGIFSWGMLRNRTSFVGINKVVTYQPNGDPCTEFIDLNNQHDYFLFVDDGTVGRHEAEIKLKRNLEKYLSTQNFPSRTNCCIPVVSLIVGGDVDTITTMHEYVTNSPPIPVVVLRDSGRTSNLIASAHEHLTMTTSESDRKLLVDIKCTFPYGQTQADNLLSHLMQCVSKKSLITIYNLDESNGLDRIILRALLRARQLSAAEQMDFALEWNRLDVLDDDIAMETLIEALVNNQVDVVKLLLDKGLPVNRLLTKTWLTKLYNSEKDPIEALRFITPITCSRKHLSLKDVDLAINKYMGGAYRSKYFVKNNTPDNASKAFREPFNELFIWCVLTKRQSMAKLIWKYGNEVLARALVAHNLFRAMAIEAKEDHNLEVEVEELNNYAAEFGEEAYELLDYCYHQDNGRTQELLTNEMPNWSFRTCLCLAFTGHHCKLLAHSCAQLVLGDLWLGGLSTRRHTKRRIFLLLAFPFLLPLVIFPMSFMPCWITCFLEFKSREEIERISMQQAVDTFTHEGNFSCKRPSFKNKNNNDVEKGILKQQELSRSRITPRTSKKVENLGWKTKLLIFLTAPVTKFLSWSMAYFVFIFLYTYTLLIRTPPFPEWNELYVIAYIATFAVDKFREVLASEPVKFKRKLAVWISYRWNCYDAASILLFFTGMVLRLHKDTLDIGRVFYSINIVYWYIRVLGILRGSKFLGPFLVMIERMLEKMIHYEILVLVVLMSYGVFRQSLLFPYEEFRWSLVRDIFFKPYFMIYGELFVDEINPPCGNGTKPDGSFDPGMPTCVTGHWLNPLFMVGYLSVVCILMLNLLIAVFNSIFDRVAENSQRVWKFNWYAVVMEYQKKPALPPPFVIVSHIYITYKWYERRKIRFAHEHLTDQLFAFLKLDCVDAAHQYLTHKADLSEQHQFEKNAMKGLNVDREVKTKTENIRLLGEWLKSLNIQMGEPNDETDNVSLKSPETRLKDIVKKIEKNAGTP